MITSAAGNLGYVEWVSEIMTNRVFRICVASRSFFVGVIIFITNAESDVTVLVCLLSDWRRTDVGEICLPKRKGDWDQPLGCEVKREMW